VRLFGSARREAAERTWPCSRPSHARCVLEISRGWRSPYATCCHSLRFERHLLTSGWFRDESDGTSCSLVVTSTEDASVIDTLLTRKCCVQEMATADLAELESMKIVEFFVAKTRGSRRFCCCLVVMECLPHNHARCVPGLKLPKLAPNGCTSLLRRMQAECSSLLDQIVQSLPNANTYENPLHISRSLVLLQRFLNVHQVKNAAPHSALCSKSHPYHPTKLY
jgi:hypothetical protein